MRVLVFILSVLSLVTWSCPCVGSSLYRWRDKDGTIHITDVPPETGDYKTIRDRGQEGTPPASRPTGQGDGGTVKVQRQAQNTVYIPLRRVGNHFLVKMVLSSRTEGYFILDTGASLTMISPAIAEDAGIVQDGSLPIIPVKTASGIIFPPVAHVEGFSMGKLSLDGGDVLIHDIHFGKGVSGLLGMDLLSDFMVSLDTQRAVLALRPARASGPVYGGHSRRWWQGRFAFYRRTIQSLERLLKVPVRALAHYHITKERIEGSIVYYQDRLLALKNLAEDELVPLDWRK